MVQAKLLSTRSLTLGIQVVAAITETRAKRWAFRTITALNGAETLTMATSLVTKVTTITLESWATCKDVGTK